MPTGKYKNGLVATGRLPLEQSRRAGTVAVEGDRELVRAFPGRLDWGTMAAALRAGSITPADAASMGETY